MNTEEKLLKSPADQRADAVVQGHSPCPACTRLDSSSSTTKTKPAKIKNKTQKHEQVILHPYELTILK